MEHPRECCWLLTRRLLADVNELLPDRRRYLDVVAPGWNFPLTYEDVEHALSVVDPELNEALTTWFNERTLNLAPLTLGQLRRLAVSSELY
ncbi:hypothetical protein [Leifsonia soli]|uniref:Uncharacterized protein n=1 Tax=Leifsonia soli TaxID=582665 RepID=A0A852T5P3_9MICO|nr:hypothetical protein [Leifsonia soli]NYD76123.1 hypothetical protein [Leifsonia soli]